MSGPRDQQPSRRAWPAQLALCMLAFLLLPPAASAQKRYALESTAGLQPHNVTLASVEHEGQRGVRVTFSDEVRRKAAQLPLEELLKIEPLAVIEGTDFSDGVIEAEIAGVPAPDAGAGARGFVGIAFRVHPDLRTYDAFYLRPTNGRADDQVRRNHSVQYISHPDWTFQRFRNEAPERYESYVDLVPDAWTHIRIEVRGTRARLFVHHQPQPVLIVNDLKTGPQGRGSIALWINPGTIGHFRDVRVSP